MPNLQALGQITGPAECIRENVSELCRIHEAMFGYAWLSAHQRKDSPTLDGEMNGYEGLTDEIASGIYRISTPVPPEAGLMNTEAPPYFAYCSWGIVFR